MAAHGAVKLFNRFKVKTTFPDPVLAKDISTVTTAARGVYVMSA